MRRHKRAGDLEVLAAGEESPAAIAVDTKYVYWTTLGPGADCLGLLPASRSGGPLADSGPGPDTVGAVKKTRLDAPRTTITLANELASPVALSVREDLPHVYWCTAGLATNGGVWRVAK